MSSDNLLSTPSHAEEVTYDDLAVPDETLQETLQAQQEELSEKDIRFLLVKAAMNGDLEEVRRLVGEVDDIDGYLPEDRDLFKYEDEQGKKSQKEPISTALQSAARWGHREVLEELMEKGADIEAVAWRKGGRTALQAATEGGHKAVVEMLLKAGTEVNAAASREAGRTALQAAAEGGHMAVVEMLLKAGAEVNAAPSLGGRTALQAAAGGGHMAVVEMLLKAGAEVNAAPSRRDERTALQAAAEGGHMAVVEMLLKVGAEVNAAPPELDGRTALQAAAKGGHEAVVEMLLKAGAEVNAAPSRRDGRTALQAAAEGGHMAVVEMLLKAGAEVNAEPSDSNGRTALQAAAGGGHMAVVEMLLKAGAEVNAAPSRRDGRTALQAAAEGGHIAVVEMLLKAGAEVNAAPSNSNGGTALQAATEGGHSLVVEMLLKAREADASVRGIADLELFRLATVAIAYGHLAVLRLLVNSGASLDGGDSSQQTGLRLAVKYRQPAILRYILTKFPNLTNAQNYNGMTALHIATEENYAPLVRHLLAARPNLEIKDDRGRKPLDIALGGGSLSEIGKNLLANGADIRGHRMGVWRQILEPSDNQLTFLQETPTGGNAIKALDAYHIPEFQDSSDIVPRKRLYSAYGVQSKGAKELFNLPTGFLSRDSAYSVQLMGEEQLSNLPAGFSSRDSASRSAKNEAVIIWKSAALSDNRSYFSSFIDGIPGDGGSIPTSFEGIMACYISFDVLAPKPVRETTDIQVTNTEISHTNRLGQHKLMTFKTKTRKAQIFWVMWKETTNSDPQRKDPIEPNAMDLQTKPSTLICRSMHFRSTMDHGWIPNHGVEFFTLFIQHLHEQWTTICTEADIHLADSRTVVLKDEGRSPQLIAGLLKDAQRWDDFYRLLQLHTRQATMLSKFFRETPILNDEVRVFELKNRGNALEDLENLIIEMRDDCKRQISDLIERSKDLIQLEFNLVSIHEAQISTSTAMSMKRLSWITFVFLPLLFVASLFGMNVNLFNQGCPMWWWYLVVSGPAFALVFIAWLAFKYIKIEMWIENNVEDIAHSFSKEFKTARLNRERTRDLESGSPSIPPRRLGTGRWFDSKKTKNS